MKITRILWNIFANTLAVLAIVGFLATATILWYASAPELMPTLEDLSDGSKSLDAQVLQNIREQTVDIQTSTGSARAWESLDRSLLLTNYHVVKGLCTSDDCNSMVIQIRDNGTLSKKFTTYKVDVNYCSRTLDLCALKPSHRSITPSVLSTVKPTGRDTNQELFVVPRQEDFDLSGSELFQGNIVDTKSFLVTSSLPARKGYSGSPVFNAKGELMGIIAEAAPEGTRMLALLGGHYTKQSRFISSNAIQELTPCLLQSDHELCSSAVMKTFLDGAVLAGSSSEFFADYLAPLGIASQDWAPIFQVSELEYFFSDMHDVESRRPGGTGKKYQDFQTAYFGQFNNSSRQLLSAYQADHVFLGLLGITLTSWSRYNYGHNFLNLRPVHVKLAGEIAHHIGLESRYGAFLAQRVELVSGKKIETFAPKKTTDLLGEAEDLSSNDINEYLEKAKQQEEHGNYVAAIRYYNDALSTAEGDEAKRIRDQRALALKKLGSP